MGKGIVGVYVNALFQNTITSCVKMKSHERNEKRDNQGKPTYRKLQAYNHNTHHLENLLHNDIRYYNIVHLDDNVLENIDLIK